jgi:hypothetical protein
MILSLEESIVERLHDLIAHLFKNKGFLYKNTGIKFSNTYTTMGKSYRFGRLAWARKVWLMLN